MQAVSSGSGRCRDNQHRRETVLKAAGRRAGTPLPVSPRGSRLLGRSVLWSLLAQQALGVPGRLLNAPIMKKPRALLCATVLLALFVGAAQGQPAAGTVRLLQMADVDDLADTAAAVHEALPQEAASPVRTMGGGQSRLPVLSGLTTTPLPLCRASWQAW